ncbi:MAG: DUF4185 domain-containing protein [Bacteriovoracaceae bacterium]|nr:DUF4185 domain-containing protein [Bacteriovoracaceae bacterium]
MNTKNFKIIFFILILSTNTTFAAVKICPLIDRKSNDGKVLGQDGAYSVYLNGKSLWLFGDTFFGTVDSQGKMKFEGAIHNSAALSKGMDTDNCITDLKYLNKSKGHASYYLKNLSTENPKKTKLWPGASVAFEDKFYIFYYHVDIFGTGSWDFRHDGTGVATSTISNPSEIKRLKINNSTIFWKKEEPKFGVSTVVYGKYLYLLGRGSAPDYAGFLARVKPQYIENIKKYQYYKTGGTWTSSVDQAQTILDQAPPEASISYNPYLKKFVLLYDRYFRQDVVIRTADDVWGPWSKPKQIHKCTPQSSKGRCYAAKEHPQYQQKNGRVILFTLVDNSCPFCGIAELFKFDFAPNLP